MNTITIDTSNIDKIWEQIVQILRANDQQVNSKLLYIIDDHTDHKSAVCMGCKLCTSATSYGIFKKVQFKRAAANWSNPEYYICSNVLRKCDLVTVIKLSPDMIEFRTKYKSRNRSNRITIKIIKTI